MTDSAAFTSDTTNETELAAPSPEELKTPLGLVPETSDHNGKKKVLTAVGALIFLGLVIGLSIGLTANMDKEEEESAKKLAPVNTTAIDNEEPDWCGNGYVGNGLCPDGHCCSLYGHCGYQDEYCVNGQTVAPEVMRTDRFCGDGFPGNGTCANSTLCCSIKGTCEYTYCACGYWPDNRTRGAPCGNGNVGDGVCEDPIYCCSKWGYCGPGEEFCNNPPGRRGLRATNTTPILIDY